MVIEEVGAVRQWLKSLEVTPTIGVDAGPRISSGPKWKRCWDARASGASRARSVELASSVGTS
jgi:hypothetical protein